MIKFRKLLKLFFILVLVSCREKNIVVLYENSSQSDIQIEVKVNSQILDTISIPKVKNQPIQKSIRKAYPVLDQLKFTFRELNSGIEMNKTVTSSDKNFCFYILANDKSNNQLTLDSASMDYLPNYQ